MATSWKKNVFSVFKVFHILIYASKTFISRWKTVIMVLVLVNYNNLIAKWSY